MAFASSPSLPQRSLTSSNASNSLIHLTACMQALHCEETSFCACENGATRANKNRATRAKKLEYFTYSFKQENKGVDVSAKNLKCYQSILSSSLHVFMIINSSSSGINDVFYIVGNVFFFQQFSHFSQFCTHFALASSDRIASGIYGIPDSFFTCFAAII